MNIRNKGDIRVYNECPFQVNLVGQKREYIFPPCVDGEPTMNFVSFDEIEYAHSRGKLFSIGLLIFDADVQEEMYAALGIKDWQDKVWFDKDIEDVIVNPTLDKMQRVINIKELITLERVRGKMVYFVNHGRDVSQNVISIINSRYREITSGNVNSKIVIRPADVEKPVSSSEVEELKKQLAQMQKLMEQMAAGKNTEEGKDKSTAAVKEVNVEDEVPAKKQAQENKPIKRTMAKKQ